MGKGTSPSQRLALARGEDTTSEVLAKLAAQADPELRLALISNLNLPAHFLAEFAKDSREIVRAAVALATNTSAALLTLLADDPRPVVRRGVAKNSRTPPTTLTKLSGDANRDVLLALVGNPATPLAVFEALIEVLDQPGRRRMAGAMPCYPSILKRLAADPSPKVRQKIARNPNLDDDMLLWLVGLDDVPLQRAVARRELGLPEPVITKILETGNKETLAALACNPAMSASVLWQLFERADPVPPDKDDYTKQDILSGLSYNLSTPPSLLLRLANDHPALRRKLAYNFSTPPEALRLLAEDDDFIVRCWVAKHPATPPTNLAKLAGDTDWGVRREALWNAATPEAERTDAVRAADPEWQIRNRVASDWNTDSEILAKLSGDQSRDVRASVAGNPNTPTRVLRRLARSRDRYIRNRAASNPNTPPEELRRLWNGGDEAFARALAWNSGRSRPSRWCNFGCGRGPSSGGFGGDV